MTDEITRALQHHVRKDEPKSVDERLDQLLETFWRYQKQQEDQNVELHNRIERLEGKLSLDQLEDLVTGTTIERTWLDEHGQLQHTRIAPQDFYAKGDPSGCICPTDSVTECPVCDEEKE